MNRILLRSASRQLARASWCTCAVPCSIQLSRSSPLGCDPKRSVSRRPFATSFLSKQQAQHAAPVEHDFNSQDEAVLQSNIQQAPAPEGALSVVFTDIVNSTMLWEQNPEAMAEAMQLHDQIIREYAAAHQGYEVKQNGDGFMMAFASAVSALQFCLDIQQRMLDQKWPAALLTMPSGKETSDEDGQVLFRGLKLRMSAHWGEPVCNWNEIINRMDYLGPVVNRAARFIQATEGGQIVVSEEFLLELQKARRDQQQAIEDENDTGVKVNSNNTLEVNLQALQCPKSQDILTDQRFEVRSLGEHEFQGIEERQRIFFIVPHSLRGRLEHWPRHKHIPGSKGNIVPNGS